MRVYKKEMVTEEKNKFQYITCDLCHYQEKDYSNWKTASCYDVSETTVKIREGSNYPEGGSGEEAEVDICTDCFKGKLIPWLQSQGVNVVFKDWDY